MENYEDQNKVVMGYNPTYEIIMSSYWNNDLIE
jgi:hypothetical protein